MARPKKWGKWSCVKFFDAISKKGDEKMSCVVLPNQLEKMTQDGVLLAAEMNS
jgi:hypothetical protein